MRIPDSVVVVVDASPDRTGERAERWGERLPLRIVHLERNVGVARARNIALEQLNTDLVTVLDADDVLLPDHIGTLTSLHARAGGIASSKAQFWSPGLPPRPYQRRIRGLLPPRRDQLRRLIYRNYVFVSSLVSREDIDGVGGFTEGDRCQDMTADWDLWLRLVREGSGVALAARPTVLYRVGPESMAADPATLLRCEITQLERSKSWLGTEFGPDVDLAVAQRYAELRTLSLARDRSPSARVKLLGSAVSHRGGDWRNRLRSLAHASSPKISDRVLRNRGIW